MKKSDFEMLSNEELKTMLNDSESYSTEEIRCAKQILMGRVLGTNEGPEIIDEEPSEEIPGYSASDNRSSDDIREIKANVRTIKNCAMFFVVLTVVSMVAGIISVVALLTQKI